MTGERRSRGGPFRSLRDSDLKVVVLSLDVSELREIIVGAADRHEDMARAVRLAASRRGYDLGELQAEVDGVFGPVDISALGRVRVGRCRQLRVWRRSATRWRRRRPRSWWR